jgi:hypothetical protein
MPLPTPRRPIIQPSVIMQGTDGNDVMTGTAGRDELLGGLGSDRLDGGAGNDVLDAGYSGSGFNDITGDGAVDILIGGTGDDTFRIYEAQDSIIENAGEGRDTVIAWRMNYDLGANLEALQIASLRGDSFVGRGNDGANNLTGLFGNDTLYGMDGDDVIGDGNSFNGDDLYVGGRGNDTYQFSLFGGRDTIDNAADDNATTTDRLVWLGPSNLRSLWFKQSGNDLVLSVKQPALPITVQTPYGPLGADPTEITIKNWYSDPSSRLDSFVVQATRKTLLETSVQGLVDAMAIYDAKKAAGPLTRGDEAELHRAIAAAWK